MPSTTSLAGAVLLAGVAAANPFTTFDVCPGADPTVAACTVTAQHQPISTCSPVSTTCSTVSASSTPTWGGWESTSASENSTSPATTPVTSCSTAYSYSTWAWVSTVIPCAWDGKSISSCTVTSTQQAVPCEISVTTSTSSTPTHTDYVTHTYTFTPTGTPTGTETTFPITTSTSVSTIIDYSTSYQTISKMWNAPYNMLGPNAIPGYSGNDLYHDDSTVDGESAQFYNVTECEAWDGKAPSCSSYTENHYDTISGYHSSTPVTATNAVHTSVPSAGLYTFTFTNSAPSAVITSQGQAYTQPAQPWFNYETRSASGPTNFDFTVTVTKTISVYWPGSTSTGKPSSVAQSAAYHGWANWNAPSKPTAGSDPSSASGSSGWGSWGNAGHSSPSATSTGGWNGPPHGSSPHGAPPSGASSSGNGGFAGFPGAPGSGTFYIPVDTSSGSKYSTSGNQWIGFPNGGDDGAVVSGQGNAAKFYWDSEGNLMCNGQYVSTSTSAGYLVFELGPNKPSGSKFSVGSDGSFGLSGAGFCSTDDTLFITFGGSPNGCKPVSCPIGSNSAASSSGWGQWAAATSSSSWTTSTSTASSTGAATSAVSAAASSTAASPEEDVAVTGTSGAAATSAAVTAAASSTAPGIELAVTATATSGAATSSVVATSPAATSAAATTTAGSSAVPSSFVIPIILPGAKMARRSTQYVGVSGALAILTSDVSTAASFTSSAGEILLLGTTSQLGASAASGTVQLELFPAGSNNALSSFDISGGSISYPGANFCVAGTAVNIYFGNVAPAGCLAATLSVQSTADALAEDAVAASTTADPSADNAVATAAATATPANRKRGGVLRV